MARQRLASEFNTFVGGFITEASPLTFPGNAAVDIDNFSINKTGPITRRLGMDFEVGSVLINTGLTLGASGELAINTFNWNNAGGDITAKLLVIQTGNILKFFNANEPVLSNGLIYTHTYVPTLNVDYSATVVDGILVVATGEKELSKFEYDGTSVTHSTYILKVRDLFGVEDVLDGLDLRDPSNLNVRPQEGELTGHHIYNLRNSTYAKLRVNESEAESSDPIESFFTSNDEPFRVGGQRGGVTIPVAKDYPSNSDSLLSALYADPNISSDRFTERFFPKTLRRSPTGNFESPKGYFVIDALSRGTSRAAEAAKLELSDSRYIHNTVDLPLDKTPGGASVVEEFAGRVWYAGFSGEVMDGDAFSPRLSSYVMFSSLVESPAGLGSCHQIGDPTSKESPDIVDTDGGFIRLDGAYGIVKMVNIGSNLVVVASNGVWAILGGSDYGFTALAYRVVKITNHGCLGKNSIVLLDNTIVYWGDDGIYHISSNDVGDLVAANITNQTIQTYYDNISELDKESVQGHYDSYERKVRWLFGNRLSDSGDSTELIFDTTLSAFYKNTIKGVSSNLPNLVAPVEVPPFKIGEVTDSVLDSGIQVTDGGVSVASTTSIKVNGLREVVYLTITQVSPVVVYTFSKYRDDTFMDWKSYDSTGIDSPAYLITGYNGAEDFQRNKQVPHITFHLERTEDGFYTDMAGDIYPLHESSCKVQAQWEWSNSAASGRWGREFQAYRYNRVYMPEDASDSYGTGFSLITTKNKLRGKGRVLSLLIKTEPLKDCRLLGWSTITSVANSV